MRTCVLILTALIPSSFCCSSVRVTQDHIDVIGRSMELSGYTLRAIEGKALKPIIEWKVNKHQREHKITSHKSCGNKGGWTSKFGSVSMDVAFWGPTEGMNEAGLTISAQTLRQTQYQRLAPNTTAVCYVDFVAYVLGNFGSVAEVQKALPNLRLIGPGKKPDETNSGDFLHWTIDDASGAHIIVEVLDGVVNIHNNSVGVLTNDPDYTWHLRNLNNYVQFSSSWPTGGDAISMDSEVGTVPQPVGHGFNLVGMPGDYSPPSRFVRLFYLRQYALLNDPPDPTHPKRQPSPELNQTLSVVMGLLNNVWIVRGTVAPKGRKIFDPTLIEFTQYTVIKIPQQKEFYYKDYQNAQWKLIKLSALNFTKSFVQPVSDGTLGVADVTNHFA